MTFTGTVKGDLHNGSITGADDAMDGKRQFAFEARLRMAQSNLIITKSRTVNGRLVLAKCAW